MKRLLDAITRLPQQLLLALVQGYRLLLKPWLGNACRFEPTCSAYALQALQQHGAVVGSALSAGRVLRCQPWCDGGCDPVPAMAPRLFTRLGLGGREPTLDKKKLT
jgi:putative membrane protein insertion efficiency factor